MSDRNPQDNKRALYLQLINLQVVTRIKHRIKVQIDAKYVEMRHEQRTSTWTPADNIEIASTSNITVTIKAGHTLGSISFGKQESQVEVGGQEAIGAFWNSIDTISQNTTFDQQPATIIFKFRPSHASETTRTAVHKLQRKMETHRTVMIGKVERNVNTVLKYGTVIAEFDPMSKMAFGLANATFDFLKEQQEYDEMVSDLATRVNRILSFAIRATDDILYEEGVLLEKVIGKMYELIVDTSTFLCNYTKRNVFVSTLSSTALSEDYRRIADLNDNFSKLKEEFDRAVDIEALNLVRRSEIDRLLELLRPAHEANYQDDRGCMEGTRTALLDEIMAWAQKPIDTNVASHGTNSDKMLWLYGMPGIGKTAIANSICRRLVQKQSLGGSFFCRRDDPVLKETTRVLPTLTSKLAAIWGPFRTLVVQTWNDDPQLNPESIDAEPLVRPLKLLKKHPLHSLVLVIDALDECGEEHTRNGLLKSLLEASSCVNWLKVIMTSRPEHDIKSFCEIKGVASRDIAGVDGNQQDIRFYTKECMSFVAIRRHLPHDWPWEIRREEIVKRSGGLFIFVETFGRVVNVPNPDGPLTQILSGELGEADAELHKLYSMAISSRAGSFTSTFLSIARVIIGVASYRPLPEEAVASLMGIETRIVTTWVDDLASIFYRDEAQQGAIRVRHLSMVDFLLGTTCPENLRIDIKQTNAELAEYCLRTMTKELKFNICELETSCLPNSEIKDLADRVRLKVSEALQYSCLHWSSHLCSCMGSANKEIWKLLERFFSGEMVLYWVEVLSVMGNVPAAILALRKIKECGEAFERIQDKVEDTIRFVLAFSTPIGLSAPHTYVSALPFLPLESNLWQSTHKLFPNHFDVREGRSQRWTSRLGIWEGHTSKVQSVAYSPNGKYVASGSMDCTIRLWDAMTGVPVCEPLREHTGSVSSVAYSPDSRYLVSGSYDGTVQIWEAATGVTVGDPLDHDDNIVTSVTCSPNGQYIASGSMDCTIRIWDALTGAAVGEPLLGHTSYVWSIAYSPSGDHIVSGSQDSTIRIWDVTTGAAVGEPWLGDTSSIKSVAYSPNGQYVISGSEDCTIRIWDAVTGAAVGEPLKGHTDFVTSVTYLSNGRYIVSGSEDKTIRIWDSTTREPVGEPWTGHTGYVTSVASSPEGRHIVSGSWDTTVRIWDVNSGGVAGDLSNTFVLSAKYSPNGQNIVSGSEDGVVRIWDAKTGALVCIPLKGHTDRVSTVAYSPDGQYIVSGSNDQTIRIWDAVTGVAVGKPWKGLTSSVTKVAYSPDGQHVASGSEDNTVQIWDAKTGKEVCEPMRGHDLEITSVTYSPNGHHIVSTSYDETIRVWNAKTGAAIGEPWRDHPAGITSAAYSPDGQHIISGSIDNTIRIWDAITGAAVGGPLIGHTKWVLDVAYSPDGQRIVSGSLDRTIRIWNAKTGREVCASMCGHAHMIMSVAYSPSGHHVVSASMDRTIRVWDVAMSSQNSNRLISRVEELSSCISDNAPSDFGIAQELLDPDGWVRCNEGLLFWIPEDCRSGLTSQSILTIPTSSRHKRVRLDFSNFQYGSLWTNIHKDT